MKAIATAPTEREARVLSSDFGRSVLREYSTSFFTVTRFLPTQTRRRVEEIYAAVRYPDEVVDTFDLNNSDRKELLEVWLDQFQISSGFDGAKECARAGMPAALCGFQAVSKETSIPPEYYLAFMGAMKLDVGDISFDSWSDLIDKYVYGSATVVGYFLAHVYGSAITSNHSSTLAAAKNLAVALQLTNFARDVKEDYLQGRQYAPTNVAGLPPENIAGFREWTRHCQVLLSQEAERWFEKASKGMDTYSEDCLTATNACLNVYRRLNRKILSDPKSIDSRASLSMREKLSELPVSKYWVIPSAFLGR